MLFLRISINPYVYITGSTNSSKEKTYLKERSATHATFAAEKVISVALPNSDVKLRTSRTYILITNHLSWKHTRKNV